MCDIDLTKTYLLNDYGRNLIDSAFLSSQDQTLTFSKEICDPLIAPVPLARFAKKVDDYLEKYAEDERQKHDGALAVAIHKALQVPRFVAAQNGFWHYLGCLVRPEYVRWRWANPETGMVSRERFVGGAKRQAFARLWWSAEITCDSGEYSLTKKLWGLEGAQDFFEAVFGRRFSNSPVAVRSFTNVLSQNKRGVVREVAKLFSRSLSTLVLEDMSDVEIESHLILFLSLVKHSE